MPAKSESPAPRFLAPSEFRVFLILSRRHPLTVREISQELTLRHPDTHQAYTTLATLVHRLVKKGYVAQEGSSPHQYRPTVDFDAALRAHVEHFLDELALGDPAELRVVLETVTGRLPSRS